jgi:thymidylate kinase
VLAWWETMYAVWAGTLDTVIYMDAPNDILFERIRSREQEHGLKNEPFEQAALVLDTYRGIYEDIFTRLKAESPRPRLLRYESTALPKNMFHNEVLREIIQDLTNKKK